MKKTTTKFRLGKFKYLLFLPILLFSFCEDNTDDFSLSSEDKLTKYSKVFTLMKSAVESESDRISGETSMEFKGTNTVKNKGTADEEDQCTYFDYPMTLDRYSGDDLIPEKIEINSDEELIAFIDTLHNSYQYYILFPIVLLDSDGVPTELNTLEELEGTLTMAVDACNGMDDDNDGSDDDSDNDGSDDDSDNDGSDDDSDDDGSDDDSDDSDDDGSDDGSDDDSSDDDNDDDNSLNVYNDDDDNEGYEYCDKKKKKVRICHKGKTICISVNAIWGHMQHHEEDYLGSCEKKKKK